ncbi:MAG TPA: hypothetical protein VFD73_10315 [Gemmatimonadales bacterium]|nr:hypothetical protein [Gemmatimonadales bacterium]
MRRPVWLLVPAILVAAMACGHSAPAASQVMHSGPAESQATETTFYLADSGRDVTVNVGDRLSLNLGSSSDRHWVLSGFPRGLFSAPAEHPRGDFTFTALAPGRTRVVVINTFACPPATVHGCSKPERGNTPSGSPAASRVPGVFTLTVHVAQDP